MVGVDDPRPLHAPLLQNPDGGEMVLDFLLIFLRDSPPPQFQDRFDEAPGELWQGGSYIVLDVELMRMPPLVGGR